MRHFRHEDYPRRRTAYGPRDGCPHAYVGEAESLSAREIAALPQVETLGLRFAERAMPRGGVRLLVSCPSCQRPCARLYTTTDAPRWATFWPWVCRQCAGLVYWRQYAGRRPEADLSRVRVSVGRYRGWQEALATWAEREAQHDARAWAALTINRCRLEQMIAYHHLLDELNAAAHESVAAYARVKRQSAHAVTIVDLARRIRELRAQQQRQRRRQQDKKRAA